MQAGCLGNGDMPKYNLQVKDIIIVGPATLSWEEDNLVKDTSQCPYYECSL